MKAAFHEIIICHDSKIVKNAAEIALEKLVQCKYISPTTFPLFKVLRTQKFFWRKYFAYHMYKPISIEEKVQKS